MGEAGPIELDDRLMIWVRGLVSDMCYNKAGLGSRRRLEWQHVEPEQVVQQGEWDLLAHRTDEPEYSTVARGLQRWRWCTGPERQGQWRAQVSVSFRPFCPTLWWKNSAHGQKQSPKFLQHLN